MKKSCHNCKHLEHVEDCDSDGYPANSGFTCNKRDMDDIKLENNMQRDKYLEKSKVCCDRKSK
ncbi:MAG: hypothetical protein K6L81_01770 [Agarilytica sp.]